MGLSSAIVTSSASRTWLRLRDVRIAFLRRSQLTAVELQDLRTILNALPEPWRTTLGGEPPDRLLGWQVISAPGAALTYLEGPHPLSQLRKLWLLVPATGQLIPAPTDAFDRDPSIAPRPARVVPRDLPQHLWTRNDYTFMEEQSRLPKKERRALLQPRLVGLWEEMCLDPRVWGLNASSSSSSAQDQDNVQASPRSISLLNMTVKAARLCFADNLAKERRIPNYNTAGAVLPRLWTSPASAVPASAITPDTPDDDLRILGLEGLEERWCRHLSVNDNTNLDTWPPGSVDRQPQWLDLTTPRHNTARGARAAARAQLSPPAGSQPPPQDHANNTNFCGVWTRLCDPTLTRASRITCWSILHGTIGCHAFLQSILGAGFATTQDRQAALACGHPACMRANIPENISHAFLDCPAVAPAIDWLLQAWQVLSGSTTPPPRTAAVLLADDIAAWPQESRPSRKSEVSLWTRLRVSVIGAIWKVRCQRSTLSLRRESFARCAIATAVSALVEAIQRDFLRTQQDLRTLDSGTFCTAWWRGRDTKLSMDKFKAIWTAAPFFCSVVEGEEPNTTLQLKLGVDQPIPFPP